MMDIGAWQVVLLLGWGTLVGLDLVSGPQVMIARPLVAAAVAGLILGDVEAALRIGVVLELFALDVLPVGAARYPDYGPATVAATALAAGQPWQAALGPAVLLGLGLAVFGGWSMLVVRHANARSIQRRSAGLAAGDAGTIRELQYLGVTRDALRSLLLTAGGLAIASLAPPLGPSGRGWLPLLGLLALALGLGAVGGGALRSAGSGKRFYWLLAGCLLGLIWVAIQ